RLRSARRSRGCAASRLRNGRRSYGRRRRLAPPGPRGASRSHRKPAGGKAAISARPFAHASRTAHTPAGHDRKHLAAGFGQTQVRLFAGARSGHPTGADGRASGLRLISPSVKAWPDWSWELGARSEQGTWCWRGRRSRLVFLAAFLRRTSSFPTRLLAIIRGTIAAYGLRSTHNVRLCRQTEKLFPRGAKGIPLPVGGQRPNSTARTGLSRQIARSLRQVRRTYARRRSAV